MCVSHPCPRPHRCPTPSRSSQRLRSPACREQVAYAYGPDGDSNFATSRPYDKVMRYGDSAFK